MKAKVEGHVNIYKDTNSGVIVNHDNSERSRYRLAKEQAKQNLRSQDDISELKKEIDEIKSLLQQLINK
jgi:hypothetical protein